MATALHAAREALEELWQQGISGHELLRRQTRLADEFLIGHFNGSGAVREAKGNVALVALGGYGRGELYPFSDIDLLLLHGRGAKDMQSVAESILYPLWDSGYEVGHSVRTPEGAVSFARADFIFQVSLLDARFLAGSSELFTRLRERYQKKILDGGRSKFVEVMEGLRTERRQRYGSHSYLLEPHIKEGKGGLRDIQAMLWVGKAVFGLAGLAAMEEAGLLSSQDRGAFERSWNVLVRIRNRLHYLSQRKNDQLFFEYQEEMAAAFGYQDSEGMLGVEHFMREVYSHLQTIAVITDLFFEHVREVVGYDKGGRKERQLEKDIVLRNGSVRLAAPPEELARKPHLLLRLFLQAGKTGRPLHHRTRQMISDQLPLVDEHFRAAKRAARSFLELLADSNEPQPVLEAMLETGLLTAYLPEFAGVESLVQHDLYHIYTVDRHLLETVGQVARLRQGSEGELFRGLASPHLLLLAALLHDIGKGRRTDHSELGAALVRTLGARISLEEREQECLAFLVRFHLFLPENAMRRDLEDVEFIRQSAEVVRDIDRLTMLYLLTIADSKATGPQAWSSWKASLVTDYYLRIKACLEAACIVAHGPVAASREEARGAEWLRAQVADLVGGAGTRISINDLPDDYLLSFSAETVARHLQLHREKAGMLQQKVLLFPEARQGYWSLLVMSPDRAGLLAKVCGVLALHNLSVLGAHIFTWPDQTAVDVLHVVPVAGVEFTDQDWPGLENDINLAVNYRLDVGLQLYQKIFAGGLRPKRQVQQLRQEVIVDNDTSQRFTVLEVYAGDQPGMLYHLTQTISDFGLDIHRARIATEVEQLIDIFYVAGRDGGKLDDPARIALLRDALMHIVHQDEVPA